MNAERAVEVNLDLAAIGLGDGHLVAVACEVGRDRTCGPSARSFDCSRLSLGRRGASDRLLSVLARRGAVRWHVGSWRSLRSGWSGGVRRGGGGVGDRTASKRGRADGARSDELRSDIPHEVSFGCVSGRLEHARRTYDSRQSRVGTTSEAPCGGVLALGFGPSDSVDRPLCRWGGHGGSPPRGDCASRNAATRSGWAA